MALSGAFRPYNQSPRRPSAPGRGGTPLLSTGGVGSTPPSPTDLNSVQGKSLARLLNEATELARVVGPLTDEDNARLTELTKVMKSREPLRPPETSLPALRRSNSSSLRRASEPTFLGSSNSGLRMSSSSPAVSPSTTRATASPVIFAGTPPSLLGFSSRVTDGAHARSIDLGLVEKLLLMVQATMSSAPGNPSLAVHQLCTSLSALTGLPSCHVLGAQDGERWVNLGSGARFELQGIVGLAARTGKVQLFHSPPDGSPDFSPTVDLPQSSPYVCIPVRVNSTTQPRFVLQLGHPRCFHSVQPCTDPALHVPFLECLSLFTALVLPALERQAVSPPLVKPPPQAPATPASSNTPSPSLHGLSPRPPPAPRSPSSGQQHQRTIPPICLPAPGQGFLVPPEGTTPPPPHQPLSREPSPRLMELKMGPSLSAEEKALAKTVEFETLKYKECPTEQERDRIMLVVAELFTELGLVFRLQLDLSILLRFLRRLKGLYADNPYHNFYHACDVTQMMAVYLATLRPAKIFSEVEELALLVTCLLHDVGHRGLTNQYQLKRRTPLGILCSVSGLTSVMEHYHCAVAASILSDPLTNPFHSLTQSQAAWAHEILFRCIMATDMARHAELCPTFSSVLGGFTASSDFSSSNPSPEASPLSSSLNSEGRLVLMQLLIKAADLSSLTRPFAISEKWGAAIREEFFLQGDMDRAEGLEILGGSAFDRFAGVTLPDEQVGFLDAIGVKFFDLVAACRPELEPWSQAVRRNREQWIARKLGDSLETIIAP
eukprot:RCo023205